MLVNNKGNIWLTMFNVPISFLLKYWHLNYNIQYRLLGRLKHKKDFYNQSKRANNYHYLVVTWQITLKKPKILFTYTHSSVVKSFSILQLYGILRLQGKNL